MIAFLRGRVLDKHPNRIVIDVNGVGYELYVPLSTYYDVGETGTDITLRVHTHVREDTIALYGFLRSAEKLLFEKLITVSGIGPKLAITILSGMPADKMVGAIRGTDARSDPPGTPRPRSRCHQAGGRRLRGSVETARQRERRADEPVGSGQAKAAARSDRAGSDARRGRAAATP